MSLFDKLRGKKQEEPQPPKPVSPQPQTSAKAKTFKVWDSYGRIMEISGEDWRTKVLPGSFKTQWDNPDKLYDVIRSALNDGFFQDSLEPCRRFCAIDTQPPRGAILLGFTLHRLGRLDEAGFVLKSAIGRYGENGYLLTNLAKVYDSQGKAELTETTLWHSIELDPNQDGVLWWAARYKEKVGAGGWEVALSKAAQLPGTWRPQIWLGRSALERNDLPSALGFYRQAIQHRHQLPADALMQISGDLGKHGYLREIVEMCAPLFDPKLHGLQVGNNLLKVYVDLKDAPAARRVLEQLYVEQRPDWKDSLLFWEAEIDKLDKGYGLVPASVKIQVRMLTLDEPIWARSKTVFAELLPAKSADVLRIAFVCGSAEQPPLPTGNQMVSQPSNNIGRFSRGFPLFLTEQVNLQTDACGVLLVPWLTQGGFVLSGRWDFEHLGTVEPNIDYLVFFHLVAKQDPWEARLKLMRVIDQKILSEWGGMVDWKDAAAGILELCTATLAQLQTDASITIKQTPLLCSPPEGVWLPHYLVGLEQALAVSCAAMAPDTHPFLYAERSILDHLLEISLGQPTNIRAHFLLLSTVQREAKARPDVAGEYRVRLEQLQREHPLEPAAQAIAQAALASIFPIPK